MKRQTVIVIITPDLQVECWGNLKKACIDKGWSYNSMSRKKLPVEYRESKIYRVPFR